MDNLIKEYKITKQNIIKKLKIKENFWKEKDNFLKEFKIENRIDQKIYNQITSVSSSLNISNIINTIPNPITDLAGNFSNKLKDTLYSQISIKSENKEIPSNIPNKENLTKDKNNNNNVENLPPFEEKNFELKKLNSIAKLIENKNKSDNKNKENDTNTNYDNSANSYNPYQDSSQILNLMKKNDTKDLDKTKSILFGLSDLMTNFSSKVLQHQEMTQTSI
jgi:hypothetical protein